MVLSCLLHMTRRSCRRCTTVGVVPVSLAIVLHASRAALTAGYRTGRRSVRVGCRFAHKSAITRRAPIRRLALRFRAERELSERLRSEDGREGMRSTARSPPAVPTSSWAQQEEIILR